MAPWRFPQLYADCLQKLVLAECFSHRIVTFVCPASTGRVQDGQRLWS